MIRNIASTPSQRSDEISSTDCIDRCGAREKSIAPNLEGRVAIVTGASRGFGKRIAETLGGCGARVVLLGRNGEYLDGTAHGIIKSGGRALPLVCDVSDSVAVAETFDEIFKTFGAVDFLINNAGETGPIDQAWQVNATEWWKTFETNLLGTFLCTHSALPHMVARRQGIVVNIASHAGIFRWPTVSAYAVSKSALIKLTENLAAETMRYGISVFAFHPGLLPIGLTELDNPAAVDPRSPKGRVVNWFEEQLKTGKVADVEQSLDMVAKLVSGRYRSLSGCYIGHDNDLDMMQARLRNMGRHSDLYRLRLHT